MGRWSRLRHWWRTKTDPGYVEWCRLVDRHTDLYLRSPEAYKRLLEARRSCDAIRIEAAEDEYNQIKHEISLTSQRIREGRA